MNPSAALHVRPPAVAGMFYPSRAATLKADVQDLLAQAAPPALQGTIVGLIAPHAGYVYSGAVAAYAYRLLAATPVDAVILIGPSHREYFEGVSVFPGDAYRTPLGDMPIDDGLRRRLVAAGVARTLDGHRTEHALEVQLPFLQVARGTCPIVPLVMGSQRREDCTALGAAIASTVGTQRVAIVASSDLSHYHPYDEAVTLDHRVVDLVETFDIDELLRRIDEDTVEACGAGPIAAAMIASKQLGANRARVLQYCNSGDVTGDRGAVVGYLSAAFVRENG